MAEKDLSALAAELAGMTKHGITTILKEIICNNILVNLTVQSHSCGSLKQQGPCKLKVAGDTRGLALPVPPSSFAAYGGRGDERERGKGKGRGQGNGRSGGAFRRIKFTTTPHQLAVATKVVVLYFLLFYPC